MKIEHEMISMAIFLPSTDLGRVVIGNKQKYVHKVLVNCLVKLVHGKLWLVEWKKMTIAVDWDVKHQNQNQIVS